MRPIAVLVQSCIRAVPNVTILRNSFVQAFCASWFIALVGLIKVPFYPVPMSLQSLGIMLVALLATPSVATGAVLLYLSYAAAGIPLLAGGGGLQALVGPTAGYLLVGFIAMAGVMSSLVQWHKDSNVWTRFGFALLGNVFLFVPGVSYLAYLFNWDVALAAGLMPFVLTMLAKSALAACLSVYLRDQYKRS